MVVNPKAVAVQGVGFCPLTLATLGWIDPPQVRATAQEYILVDGPVEAQTVGPID
jgi:hypothetical protein